MRKRSSSSNTPIRTIAVRPALARERVARSIARRFAAAAAGVRAMADAPRVPPEPGLEQLDLDERVRLVGEW